MKPLRYSWTVLMVGGLTALFSIAGLSYRSKPPYTPFNARATAVEEVRRASPKDASGKQGDPDEKLPKGSNPENGTGEPTAEYIQHMKRAREHVAAGRWDLAIEEFEAAEKTWPESEEVAAELEAARQGKARAVAAERLRKAADKVMEAQEAAGKKRHRTSLKLFEEALTLHPENQEAKKGVVEAKSTLETFEKKVAQGRAKLKSKQFDVAFKMLQEAINLVADDAEVPGLIAEARKGLTAKPLMEGNVFVLVLFTNSSSLKGGEHRDKFIEQLEKIQKESKSQLLDRKVYVMTKAGVVPWSSAFKTEIDKAHDNAAYTELFKAAFREVETWKKKTAGKEFQTILIWETDFDPDNATDRKVEPTAEQRKFIKLCVRYTGDKQLKAPVEWFGDDHVARPRHVEAIGKQVIDLIDAK